MFMLCYVWRKKDRDTRYIISNVVCSFFTCQTKKKEVICLHKVTLLCVCSYLYIICIIIIYKQHVCSITILTYESQKVLLFET